MNTENIINENTNAVSTEQYLKPETHQNHDVYQKLENLYEQILAKNEIANKSEPLNLTNALNNIVMKGGLTGVPGIGDVVAIENVIQSTFLTRMGEFIEQEYYNSFISIKVDAQNEEVNSEPKPNQFILDYKKQPHELYPVAAKRFRKSNALPTEDDTEVNAEMEKKAIECFENHIDDLVFADDNDVSRKIFPIFSLTKPDSPFQDSVVEEIAYKNTGDIIDKMINMKAYLPRNLINDSVFITSPRIFAALQKMKNEQGDFLIINNTISGHRVILHENLDKTNGNIVFANLKKGLRVIQTKLFHNEQHDTKDIGVKFDSIFCGYNVSLKEPKAFTFLRITDLPDTKEVKFQNTEA